MAHGFSMVIIWGEKKLVILSHFGGGPSPICTAMVIEDWLSKEGSVDGGTRWGALLRTPVPKTPKPSDFLGVSITKSSNSARMSVRWYLPHHFQVSNFWIYNFHHHVQVLHQNFQFSGLFDKLAIRQPAPGPVSWPHAGLCGPDINWIVIVDYPGVTP